jgi:type IV secretion system protein VirD4
MSGFPLTLGRFARTGDEYEYEGDESLITVARPGRGKSQALVVRNLLRHRGPAVVLDVKPELYKLTAGWRSKGGRPVVYFRPTDVVRSAHFNPFDLIPTNKFEAPRIIKQLVRLLMVPKDQKSADSFWESRAAQYVAAAMTDIALNAKPERRNMTSVVEWLSPGSDEALKEQAERLQDSGVLSLRVIGGELARSSKGGTRDSLLATAQQHIQIWGEPEVEGLTGKTTWSFADIRERNGTVYLCVTPEELKEYASLIRIILGRALQEFREGSGPQVTFFVDEFPQLGYMPELMRMLELGRGAGCRLWLFTQTVGQIEEQYGSHLRGAIFDMCAIQSFIEPTNDLARHIEKLLPAETNIYTGEKKPLATAHDLAGPAYQGKVIVIEGGLKPAVLDRVFAFDDHEIVGRMNLPV